MNVEISRAPNRTAVSTILSCDAHAALPHKPPLSSLEGLPGEIWITAISHACRANRKLDLLCMNGFHFPAGGFYRQSVLLFSLFQRLSGRDRSDSFNGRIKADRYVSSWSMRRVRIHTGCIRRGRSSRTGLAAESCEVRRHQRMCGRVVGEASISAPKKTAF